MQELDSPNNNNKISEYDEKAEIEKEVTETQTPDMHFDDSAICNG